MRTFGYTVGTILKRPFIIAYFAVLALALCTFELYFPVLDVIFKLGTFNSNDILASIIYLLQLVLKLVLNPKGILFLLLLIIVGSLLAGLLFSGWLYMINNTLEHRKKIKAELMLGIKEYFGKISLITGVSSLLGVIFIIVCVIASVPAIVITKAAMDNKAGLLMSAVIINVITLGVLFFAVMFFRIYISHWYMAAYNHKKNSFLMGKKKADSNFWTLVRSFFAFDIVFIVFTSFFLYADKLMGDDIILFIVKWIFSTVFFTMLVTYLFVLFKKPSGSRER